VAAFIRRLRRDGLDRHFDEVRRASARPDRDDRKVLDEAEEEAAGQSLADYARVLAARRLALRAARDDRNGVELTTVHRAKGRQWPRVVVVACDEGVLPHRNAMQASPEEEAAGEGVEAERHIADVACTRARTELSILHATERHSRFLHEAGLVAAPAKLDQRQAARSRAGFWQAQLDAASHRRPGRAGTQSLEDRLDRAREVGLHHALTVIADRRTALEFAAVTLERNLVGASTRSDKLTVRQFLKAIGALSGAEREAVRRGAGTQARAAPGPASSEDAHVARDGAPRSRPTPVNRAVFTRARCVRGPYAGQRWPQRSGDWPPLRSLVRAAGHSLTASCRPIRSARRDPRVAEDALLVVLSHVRVDRLAVSQRDGRSLLRKSRRRRRAPASLCEPPA
jgi:UvrD-like helicase C-terminal domain